MSVTASFEHRLTVEIIDPEDNEFEWRDRISASWRPNDSWGGGSHWEVSGENCGAGNRMLVHPYQIDGIIELLQTMKRHSVEESNK